MVREPVRRQSFFGRCSLMAKQTVWIDIPKQKAEEKRRSKDLSVPRIFRYCSPTYDPGSQAITWIISSKCKEDRHLAYINTNMNSVSRTITIGCRSFQSIWASLATQALKRPLVTLISIARKPRGMWIHSTRCNAPIGVFLPKVSWLSWIGRGRKILPQKWKPPKEGHKRKKGDEQDCYRHFTSGPHCEVTWDFRSWICAETQTSLTWLVTLIILGDFAWIVISYSFAADNVSSALK